MKLHDRILQIPANELVHSRGRSSNGVVALWVLIMSLLARQMYQIIKRKMVSFWSRKEWICKMVKAFEFHPPLGPINVEGSWNWNGTRHPLKVGKEKNEWLSVSIRGHREQELWILIENLEALSAVARTLLKSLQAKVLREEGIVFYFGSMRTQSLLPGVMDCIVAGLISRTSEIV
jgi:hypothetical protein